ncbi:unnamed protein product, partial [Ectocarpus fasciculatus]
MTLRFFTVTAALMLGACATVREETRTSAVLEGGFYGGERYELRTRLIEGPTGTYSQTSVVYKGLVKTCILDSPNDCESKARNL